MKQTITLNESQLGQMIAEAINELDWKTYMNAAKKSFERGPMFQTYDTIDGSHNRNERSRRFAKAAEDALNRDFGYEKTYKSGNKGQLRFTTPWDLRDSEYDDRMGREIPQKAHFVANKEYADGGMLSDVGPRGGWGYNEYDYKHYKNPDSSWGYELGERLPKSDIYRGDTKFKDAINRGETELKNYERGNYEYTPEQGWHLKDEQRLEESIRRSIRKYLH